MKQDIITMMKASFSENGISYQEKTKADIAIATEFLDASWGSGNKKINYEAFILLDENQKTVYMFEKTLEVSKGFSFGSNSSSFSQTGTTLFRKVKSIQYGVDGKAYEYEFDLGAIPKAVKNAATRYNWKFKTVLSSKKAMYPEGYVAPQLKFCGKCGNSLKLDAKFCGKCGNAVS